MKFIKIIIISLFIFSCSKKPGVNDPYQLKQPYKLLKLYSKKIKPEINLDLMSYGYNIFLPKDYEIKNGIGNFKLGYYLKKSKTDLVTLEEARNKLVFLVENLLGEINTNTEINPYLDIHPFDAERISIAIYIIDENKVQLGQGIAIAHLLDGKIKYEGYDIEIYRDTPPARGKHYTIHEETYADALEIVKKQGNLKYLE